LVATAAGVRILTAALDDGLNELKFIVPGLGDYGDRYYGNRSVSCGVQGRSHKWTSCGLPCLQVRLDTKKGTGVPMASELRLLSI
jgi:hypothetical protein